MLVNKRCTSGNVNLLRCLFPKYELITENNIPEKPTRQKQSFKSEILFIVETIVSQMILFINIKTHM